MTWYSPMVCLCTWLTRKYIVCLQRRCHGYDLAALCFSMKHVSVHMVQYFICTHYGLKSICFIRCQPAFIWVQLFPYNSNKPELMCMRLETYKVYVTRSQQQFLNKRTICGTRGATTSMYFWQVNHLLYCTFLLGPFPPYVNIGVRMNHFGHNFCPNYFTVTRYFRFLFCFTLRAKTLSTPENATWVY